MRESLDIHRRLLWVLLVALCLRLAWGLSRPSDAASIERLPDQREYLELADNLLRGRGLHFVDPRFGQEIQAYRTPGYPMFLAACGASARVARVVQALIDTSSVLAIYLLSRRWLGTGASLLAASVVTLNPFLIYFSGLILSETLFTAMLIWGMVLLAGGLNLKPRPLLGGLILALSVLVRPSGIGLPILLGIAAAVLNRKRASAYPQWWPLPPATTMLLFTLAALTPWAWRNSRVLGRWVWTTTNAGITAYDGFNDDATGASDQRFTRALRWPGQADEVGRDEYFGDLAAAWVRHHRGRAIELAGAKIARTWSPLPLSAEFGRPLYRWIAGLYAVPLDLMLILGLLHGRLPRGAKAFVVLPAIYITLIHAMSVGSLRYRIPAEPLIAIVAASVWARKSDYRRAEA